MPDTYLDFAELAMHEREGRDYRITSGNRPSPILIIAPHGGRIEPFTSEIAKLIAGSDYSLYLFEGLKKINYRDLHITSHHFFEPALDKALQFADIVITVHGCKKFAEELIILGGLDSELYGKFRQGLRGAGFLIKENVLGYEGKNPLNICNRGRTGKGVQLEITYTLRKRIDEDQSLRSRFGETIRLILQASKMG